MSRFSPPMLLHGIIKEELIEYPEISHAHISLALSLAGDSNSHKQPLGTREIAGTWYKALYY